VTVSSSNAETAPLRTGGGRAIWPGSRRLRAGLAIGLLVAVAVAGYLLAQGGSNANPLASLKYGKIPSWLPSAKPPPNQIVTATEASPVLAAIEGNTIDAQLAGGSAMVTVVGPAIPTWVSNQAQSGHWGEGQTAPSTFTITFAQVKGVIPLAASQFQILTTQGQVLHPAITTSTGKPLPSEVKPGTALMLTAKTGLNEGEGALRWVPVGTKVLAAWTYELELD
jgi:hypothetical protein